MKTNVYWKNIKENRTCAKSTQKLIKYSQEFIRSGKLFYYVK